MNSLENGSDRMQSGLSDTFVKEEEQKDEAGVDKSHPLIHLIRGFTFALVTIKIYVCNRETEQNKLPPQRDLKSLGFPTA
jgi:hypothetical protein